MDWASIGANAISSGINSLLGLGGNAIAYKQQKKLMRQQYDYQKQFFDYTSEYNSPAKQVERLEKANINPNLALSGINGTAGQAGSMPTATPPRTDLGQVDFGVALQQGREAEVMKSQADYNHAMANKTDSEAIGVMYDNYKKAFDSNDERMAEEFKNRMRLMSSQADYNVKMTEKAGYDIGLTIAQTATEEARKLNIQQDTAVKFADELNKKAEYRNIKATYHKIVAETGESNAQKFVLQLVAKKMKAEKPFWTTNAYNEASILIQDAGRRGKLLDSEIEELKSRAKANLGSAALSSASSGSEIWDIILDIIGLFAGGNTKKFR